MTSRSEPQHGEDLSVNEVTLVGRVSGDPQRRTLPSGDEVVQLRLVVRRPPPFKKRARIDPTAPVTVADSQPAPAGGPPPRSDLNASPAVSVDTIDLAMWTAALQRKAAGIRPGDVVSIDGALRRRFWRTPSGAASRYEVEVSSLRRVRPTRPS